MRQSTRGGTTVSSHSIPRPSSGSRTITLGLQSAHGNGAFSGQDEDGAAFPGTTTRFLQPPESGVAGGHDASYAPSRPTAGTGRDDEAMATRQAENAAGADRLHSGRRALAVLEIIATRPDGATPKDVSQALGLHLSTCYRLLNTLAAAGYAFRSPETGLFHLGRRLAYLNHCYQASLNPRPEVLAFLHALQRATGETAMLCRLEGDDVVITAVVEGNRPGAHPARYSGMAGPAHSVAVGRCLLAWLPPVQREAYLARCASIAALPWLPQANPDTLRDDLEQIRQTGYAVDRGENNPEVCCVAAPVRDDSGASIAVAIVGPCVRLRREEAAMTAMVIEVARTISALLKTLPERDGAATWEEESVSRDAIEEALATVAAAMSRVS